MSVSALIISYLDDCSCLLIILFPANISTHYPFNLPERKFIAQGITLLRRSPCVFSINAICVTGLERRAQSPQLSAALCPLLFPVRGSSSPLCMAHSLQGTQNHSQSALAHAAFPAGAFVASSFTYPHSGLSDGPSHTGSLIDQSRLQNSLISVVQIIYLGI